MLTTSQNEVYNHLQRYRNFPAKNRNKFPHLAHLPNPAERYQFFCEMFAKGVKVRYKAGDGVEGEDIFEEESEIGFEVLDFDDMPMLSAVGLINQAIAS